MIELLLVEDNEKLSENITAYLSADFKITPVYNGSDALAYLNAQDFDLVILDLMLPGVDGMTVLREIRQDGKNTCVIILTAKEEIGDKLRAFDIGASDYVTKPFFMEELKARIYAVLRNAGKIEARSRITFRDLSIDVKKQTCLIRTESGEQEIELPEKQFRLLEYFMLNQGVLLFKEQIFSRICGFDSEAGESIVEVYVSYLRKKLAPYGYDKYIITKRGMGYFFDNK